MNRKKGHPIWDALFHLAAGTLAAAAAQTVAVATAAQQNGQNDDPPDVESAIAVSVTHSHYLRGNF